MTSFFEIRRPIHPLVVLLLVTGSLVFGLALAKEINVLYFYLGVFLFYLIWGYWKACLAVVPVAAFSPVSLPA